MFIRLLLLLVLGCKQVSNEIPLEPPEPEVANQTTTPIGPEYPVPDVKKVFTVKIEATNYSLAQTDKLKKAESLLTQLFNSPEFLVEMLAHKFTSAEGLTNQGVFDKLFRGAEDLQPAVNYQMDLKVEMYTKLFTRVVGYTNGSTLTVYTNSKFHDYYTPCQVASNLGHEWTHKLGFDHLSATDYSSVPYSMNDIVEKLCPKFL